LEIPMTTLEQQDPTDRRAVEAASPAATAGIAAIPAITAIAAIAASTALIAAGLLAAAAMPLQAAPVAAPATTVAALVDAYLEAYFHVYPTAATEAGRHDLDGELEDLSPPRRAAWLAENRAVIERGQRLASQGGLSLDDRLDLELLTRHASREVHDLAVRRRPERDPLFWTDRLGNATLLLMLRDPHPQAPRLAATAARVALLPRLATEAHDALAATPPSEVSPELARMAASQARASAASYRGGFLAWAAGPGIEATRARAAAASAAAALDHLGAYLETLATQASGSPRLAAQYADAFRLGTGVEEPVATVLARATADLAVVRTGAARYGRTVWPQLVPGEAPPADDGDLLRRLFARVAADHAASTAELVADYRHQVHDLEAFLRARGLVTLPEPLTLEVGPSPGYLIGQSVGGVYAAGPYEPEATTLWLLPTPADGAAPAQRDAFFRDFNHHFNVMITAHEIFPGHYLQLKVAAHQPHKVRSLFPDDTYIEGWGTFCERFALDQGWGAPLDRLAHLKKQMENVTRTIVDIRVHTAGMTRAEVIDFGRREALQDEQFAANLWSRSITSAPQLTTYWLGDHEVQALYEDVQRARGTAFSVRQFMDGMVAMGPVPVRHYRERMLDGVTSPGR
jgi:Bacterial protein of unknown function (DUF885)